MFFKRMLDNCVPLVCEFYKILLFWLQIVPTSALLHLVFVCFGTGERNKPIMYLLLWIIGTPRTKLKLLLKRYKINKIC